MAKAKPIELECPGCEVNLQLDAGFAGGVCRCFSCGTLMTVPADASGDRPERLIRPARPGEAPAQRVKRPARPAAPGSPPPAEEAVPEPADEGEHEVYTTESGRTVRISTRQRIPTATKRRVARWMTYAVFGLVIAAIVGMCVFAVIVLLHQEPPDAPGRALPVESFVYDPNDNPFTLAKPNALGLPLRERTAVIVDASEASQPWLVDVTEALKAGLTRKGGSRVELVYATEAGPRTLFNDAAPLSSVTPGSIAAVQSQVTATGVASLGAATAAALAAKPTHLILITSQRIDESQRDALRAVLAAHPTVILDAVLIDRESVLLEDLAEERMGRYVRLSHSRIAGWRAAPVDAE